MPELPEVETVRRHLQRRLPGRTVASVWISGYRLRGPVPRSLRTRSPGGRFTRVRRIAKFLFLDWRSADGDETQSLLAHLGMTGSFLLRIPPPRIRPPHTHVLWRFADGAGLLFVDPRRFGILEWVGRSYRPPGVGVDPTETDLTGELLYALARPSRTPLKSFLLDQRKIAGLGNIYACEALFRAGLSPRRLTRGVSRTESVRLAVAIGDSLREAVRYRGTSFSDFRDLDGAPGENGHRLYVYGREGQPCRICSTPIRRIVQSARSTFFCPRCQRRGARPLVESV